MAPGGTAPPDALNQRGQLLYDIEHVEHVAPDAVIEHDAPYADAPGGQTRPNPARSRSESIVMYVGCGAETIESLCMVPLRDEH